MEGIYVAAGAIPGFILGAVLATLMLICVPNVHRKLTSCVYGVLRCCRPPQETKSDNRLPKNVTLDSRTSQSYSEIDEKKTRTFSPKKSLTPVRENDGYRYEDCIVGGKAHKYSDLDVDGSDKNGKMTITNTPTTNSYEPFSPGKESTVNDKRDSNHEYHILEPGSDKRLPVKMLENKSDSLLCDPGHVYFILEPGTNKVTPVSQSVIAKYTKGPTKKTADRESGHIYFVLKPMTESAESESLAYAVNDVATSPSYFILEKTDRAV